MWLGRLNDILMNLISDYELITYTLTVIEDTRRVFTVWR